MEGVVLRVLWLVVLWLVWSGVAECQRLWGREAGSVGSGGLSSVSLWGGGEGWNVSCLGDVEGVLVSAGGVLPWGLRELMEGSVCVVVGGRLCSVGGRVMVSGGEMSHFTTFGGDVARRFGRVRLGLGYRGMTHRIRYMECGRTSFSVAGVMVSPTERWDIGVAVRNLERRGMWYGGKEREVGTTWWGSVMWRARRVLSICVEMEREVRERGSSDWVGHIGVGMEVGGGLRFTAGFSTLGGEMGAGVGYEWGKWGVRAGVSHHEVLGVSGGACIVFHSKRL